MPKERAEYNRRWDTPATPETLAYLAEMDARHAAETERAEKVLADTLGSDWDDQLAAGKIGYASLLLVVKVAGRKAV